MDWMFVTVQNSHVEALSTSVAVFGDAISKEVTKVSWGHKGRALIQ